MAWTEQCKLDACAQIKNFAETKDMGIRKAMKHLAGESGIPYGTLKRWYYDEKESVPKNGNTQNPGNTTKAKAKVAAKIVKNISKAIKKDEEDALAAQANRDGAKALAKELGGAILAEELYDLYLKKVYELDEIIEANKELEDPMDASKVIDQLLRMARNVGWVELEGFCERCTFERGLSNKKTRTVTYKVACSNRTCENHVEKEKRKTTKK